MHTLGFGSGRTGAGLGRIAAVLGGVAEMQGLESGSSPTLGTCFPCSRAFLPLNVDKLCCEGAPSGAFSLLLAGRLLSLLDRRCVLRYLFMDVRGLGNMTCEKLARTPCPRSWSFTGFLLSVSWVFLLIHR